MKKLNKFKNSRINLVIGNIAEQTADALVDAANNHLWMGGGVAGALKYKGGEIIEQEIMAKGPVELKLETIAFPAFGTGVGGFSKERYARIMINEIIYHINNKSLIKRFDIVLFDHSFFTTFERELIAILNNLNN